MSAVHWAARGPGHPYHDSAKVRGSAPVRGRTADAQKPGWPPAPTRRPPGGGRAGQTRGGPVGYHRGMASSLLAQPADQGGVMPLPRRLVVKLGSNLLTDRFV